MVLTQTARHLRSLKNIFSIICAASVKISQELKFDATPLLKKISLWETNYGNLGICESIFGPDYAPLKGPYEIGFKIAKSFQV